MVKDRLQGMNIYLIGMMGAGKTTVGKALATELNYRFIDTDAVIAQVADQSIAELFAARGEPEFRDLESKVLAEVAAYQYSVVATGGGIILRSLNWSYLQCGLVVWLDVSVEQLDQRLQEDNTRPLLQHSVQNSVQDSIQAPTQAPTQNPDRLETLKTLLAERRSLYSEADLKISVAPEATPDQIVQTILAQIPGVLKPAARAKFEVSQSLETKAND
ncbi:MAG: shikimate kinase [Oscillatoriales cyanobacterium RM2_1_1]|nr:shikimate kinase [Oscillatoriales cyanobacterium SM2_3_0]NJO44786.1 shikimate kinase [Oscillatoriales cyanobacterium RM2_1_1]